MTSLNPNDPSTFSSPDDFIAFQKDMEEFEKLVAMTIPPEDPFNTMGMYCPKCDSYIFVDTRNEHQRIACLCTTIIPGESIPEHWVDESMDNLDYICPHCGEREIPGGMCSEAGK